MASEKISVKAITFSAGSTRTMNKDYGRMRIVTGRQCQSSSQRNIAVFESHFLAVKTANRNKSKKD
jgi:hypothetical protein